MPPHCYRDPAHGPGMGPVPSPRLPPPTCSRSASAVGLGLFWYASLLCPLFSCIFDVDEICFVNHLRARKPCASLPLLTPPSSLRQTAVALPLLTPPLALATRGKAECTRRCRNKLGRGLECRPLGAAYRCFAEATLRRPGPPRAEEAAPGSDRRPRPSSLAPGCTRPATRRGTFGMSQPARTWCRARRAPSRHRS